MSLAYEKWTRPLALQGILLVVLALGGNFTLHAETGTAAGIETPPLDLPVGAQIARGDTLRRPEGAAEGLG